ncbi:MAG: hypothetical protein LN413_04330 [Candidatus Thermoplasmatota archaeon]|nr:hypothetical protein [Candidatus Thermoplasmatota archaeon]
MKKGYLAFVLLATLVMASISLWAVPAPGVRGQVTLTITMADALTFSPNTFSAAPGESVSLTIINAGAVIHTFTLFGEADASVPVSDNSALQTYYNDNTPLVDVSLDGGIQDSVTFTAPTAEGIYTIVCIVPLHSVGGMHGLMTVTSAPDAEPAPIDPLLIGVVIAVVVIVIAVAAVFILRRRS